MFLTFSKAMGRVLADRDVVVVTGPDLCHQVGQVLILLPECSPLLLLQGSRHVSEIRFVLSKSLSLDQEPAYTYTIVWLAQLGYRYHSGG